MGILWWVVVLSHNRPEGVQGWWAPCRAMVSGVGQPEEAGCRGDTEKVMGLLSPGPGS